MTGKLYLVATPIGNLGDISKRAAETLRSVDFIAAEDTRVTIKLLNHLNLRKPLISYYKYNQREQAELILPRLLAGESGALVTDAGMPAISDPGEDLVRLCVEKGIEAVPIPGPCALVTALAVSGLPTQRFCFEGFLAVSGKTRREHLAALRDERRTIVLYEAPHKLLKTLADLLEALGDREVSVCRELTKLHEEMIRTPLTGALRHFTENAPRGEFVLVIRGAEGPERKEASLPDALALVEKYRAEGRPLREAARLDAADTGYGKNELYELALQK
jgi:16S rRNA (cytidine1402-2'-O)-methyltransferase